MGTHPIFESDFDCLTDVKWSTGNDGTAGDDDPAGYGGSTDDAWYPNDHGSWNWWVHAVSSSHSSGCYWHARWSDNSCPNDRSDWPNEPDEPNGTAVHYPANGHWSTNRKSTF